ncbi:PAS domain S-box protein [Actinoplanes sp. NPDC049802]|uniref:hybrid sensor histidine kinase/response regulator n=1 Tax=Actinoplanes sp. NPDC049802 TaxID=3154742 RepID=UPI0033FEA8BA
MRGSAVADGGVLVHEVFEQLLDVAPDAILGADSSGRIVFVNAQAERLFGYDRAELIGRPVETLVPDELVSIHQSVRQRYVDHPVHRAMGAGRPLWARHRDGTVFPVEISLSGMRSPTGLIVCAAVRDISDRLQAEAERTRLREEAQQARLQEQLQRTQRIESLGQLAGGVAHDFNNLLAVIINYAAFISDSAAEQAGAGPVPEVWNQIHHDSQQILRAARRGGTLTRQLLAFARQEVTRPQAVDLSTVVHEVEDMLRRSIGEHIRLVIDGDGGCGPVLADPGQLEQVLVNLAVNARDAMPGGGTLTISTDNVIAARGDLTVPGDHPSLPAGEYARLRVSDTGTGMPPEVIERVFEPFFTTKPVGKGTGLGLAMVYGIVTGAGGTVAIDSEPGRGTHIDVLLPVTSRRPASTGGEPEDADLRGHGETILLVEDEPSLRQICQRMLSADGYRVLDPDGADAALRWVADHPGEVDLLLTDVVMPQMLGTALAEEVTAAGNDIKVLYMSGYSTPLLDTQGAHDGDVALLEKPFTRAELLTAVHQALVGT